MPHLIRKLPLAAAVQLWQISSPWCSDTEKSKKCSAEFLAYDSLHCKACIIFSELQDLQKKESHNIKSRCTYRVINTWHSQCNEWTVLRYEGTPHLPALHTSCFWKLRDRSAMGKLMYQPTPAQPSYSSVFQKQDHSLQFFFFNFKPDYQVTALYCCCLPLFSISIPYFISVCFSWDLLLASHLLSTSHFADALVNLFYFSSKSLLKVLGIMSK